MPSFSYIRLPNGKTTVTCTCGWADPLGPVHPSPFDPAEALAAAAVEHLLCLAPVENPNRITGATTLDELEAQRTQLGIEIFSVFTNTRINKAASGHARAILVQHPQIGVRLGHGETVPAAIDDAFNSVRQALKELS